MILEKILKSYLHKNIVDVLGLPKKGNAKTSTESQYRYNTMNINALKLIFDSIIQNNGIEIEYISFPCKNIKFYGAFNKPNKITLNSFFSIDIQIETEVHETVHYFDVYHIDKIQRESTADYITIQIYNRFDIPMITYTKDNILSIKKAFDTLIDKNVYNSIFSMLSLEIEIALKNFKNNFEDKTP